MGQPPRPRKDVTCEVCAATFLEGRLQRLLDGPLAPEPLAPGAAEGKQSQGTPLSRYPSTLAPQRYGHRAGDPLAVAASGSPSGQRPTGVPGAGMASRRWALARFGLGIGCTVAGAAIAAFGGLLWLILPGYAMVLLGLTLIISGAAAGAI
jgi:hypothetical protein